MTRLRPARLLVLAPAWLWLGALAGCQSTDVAPPSAGAGVRPEPIVQPWRRVGDEVVVAGRLFPAGTPVVIWSDPGGFNAYADENLRAPRGFGFRADAAGRAVRGDLDRLRRVVDQFVIHYDGSGSSQRCFRTLRQRGLSVHFLLDLDGTIYQTLDLQEKCFHATASNTRSVGIEIANVGAFAPGVSTGFDRWYYHAADGGTYLRLPPGEVRTERFVGRPYFLQPVAGVIQGQRLWQYDLTPQQYQALVRLTAALCRAFPLIRCDAPRDALGNVYPQKLPDPYLAAYRGLLGHYHIQTNKIDPGPAFQWDLVITGARRLLAE